MAGLFEKILASFNFTGHTDVVIAACVAIALGSLLGGLVSGLAKAFSGPVKPIPFTQTLSLRLICISEAFLVIGIVYYYLTSTLTVEPLQIIFWAGTIAVMPVLWFLGSQITQAIFWSRIKKNREEYRKILARKRYAKHKKMRNAIHEDTRTPATAVKQRSPTTARGRERTRQVQRKRKSV